MNHAPLLLTPPAHKAAIYRRIERSKNSKRERERAIEREEEGERERIQTERGASAEESRFGDKWHNTGHNRWQ